MDTRLPTSKRPFVLIRAASDSCSLTTLAAADVKALYKEHGAVLFRGFSDQVEGFQLFCDQFCDHYLNEKRPSRAQISQDGRVQTVNLGLKRFPLHPEMAREPWQPDIAWFMCKQPAESMGQTTICDGIQALKSFSKPVQKHLKQTTLAHVQVTSLAWCREFYRQPQLEVSELLANSDTYPFKFSLVQNQLYRTYYRPMAHRPMFSPELAYGNFLVFARQNLNVRHFPCYENGDSVTDELVAEIAKTSNELAAEIEWQKNDILMLDNTRFMHGRNDIGGDPTVRQIYTQFGYCSFVPSNYPDLARQLWRQP